MISKLLIAADHAGFELKQKLMAANPELPWEDLGTHSLDRVDYPDFSEKLCTRLIALTAKHTDAGTNAAAAALSSAKTLPASTDALSYGVIGVLVCGSGQGVAIKANRYPEIRATICWNSEVAKVARAHNNSNVLCLGARFVSDSEASQILETFLGSAFEGGRHSQRVAKLY